MFKFNSIGIKNSSSEKKIKFKLKKKKEKNKIKFFLLYNKVLTVLILSYTFK